MHYVDLFKNTLKNLGYDPIVVPNTFQPEYDPVKGWPLKTPTIQFESNTQLILHFQDFATVQNNRVIELDNVEKFYGSRADQVVVTYWNHGLDKLYTGPVRLIEFSNHNYDLALALKRRQSEWPIAFARTRAWQCLNGRKCMHRRRAAKVLQNWDNGILSFGTSIVLPDWDYSNYRGCENDDNFIRLQYVYQNCLVNIVTETVYDYSPGIISEKTLMAFAAKQIPLLIGHRGIVRDCRELGFDMFDDVLDNSYDFLPNDVRLETALDLNKDIILSGINAELLEHRLEKNKNYLLNEFPGWMESRFKKDCLDRFDPFKKIAI
jgi:hypothetical protein